MPDEGVPFSSRRTAAREDPRAEIVEHRLCLGGQFIIQQDGLCLGLCPGRGPGRSGCAPHAEGDAATPILGTMPSRVLKVAGDPLFAPVKMIAAAAAAAAAAAVVAVVAVVAVAFYGFGLILLRAPGRWVLGRGVNRLRPGRCSAARRLHWRGS